MYILQNALFYKLSFQKQNNIKALMAKKPFIKFVVSNLISLPIKVATVLLTKMV